ncbi:TetR/AcrR family transcriptional regulator C-terminal domain-containing protein [Nocardia salmonicida]|uniref:TetR/AcrR family transcriptional regulator C-terminal domain-containing protein n=1 Tax=Nocardia salmonicida TaxID=53431 RepID=UPI0033D8D529
MVEGRGFENFGPSGDWLADLRQLADSFYQTSLAHPEAAILTLFRVTGGVHEIEAVETILGILRAPGSTTRTRCATTTPCPTP